MQCLHQGIKATRQCLSSSDLPANRAHRVPSAPTTANSLSDAELESRNQRVGMQGREIRKRLWRCLRVSGDIHCRRRRGGLQALEKMVARSAGQDVGQRQISGYMTEVQADVSRALHLCAVCLRCGSASLTPSSISSHCSSLLFLFLPNPSDAATRPVSKVAVRKRQCAELGETD